MSCNANFDFVAALGIYREIQKGKFYQVLENLISEKCPYRDKLLR